MIRVENIRVRFNKGTALENSVLNGLSCEIAKGEFITLIGSNGAGKSTLMNVIAGEVLPDSGRIVIDGQDVTRLRTEQRAPWIARVFQDPMKGSCPDLSIEDNLALAMSRGKRRGLSLALNKERAERFHEELKGLGLGLEERLGDPMGSLSGGQRQAVSLLMATLQPAKVLLLDEHTAALDPKMENVVLELTQKIIKEHGLSAVMITHSMSQALSMGTRTLLLHQGRVINTFSGEARAKTTPADLLECFSRP